MTGSGTPEKPPFRLQISLSSLLLVSLVFAFTAAGARYLGETLQQDTVSSRALFSVTVMLLPMLALIGANLIHLASKK